MKVSPRYGFALAALLVAAAVPWMLQASRSAWGRLPQTCAERVESQPREIRRPGGVKLRYEVAVTREPWKLYGWAPRRLADAGFPATTTRRDLSVDGAVLPLHWDEGPALGVERVRAHFFVLGGEPVESPFRAGLASAGRQLMEGRLPLVRMTAYAEALPGRGNDLAELVEERLAYDWRRYREVCGS